MSRFNLSKYRKDLGITQRDIAEKLSVTAGFISNIEKGRSHLPEEKVKLLSEAFPEPNIEDYRIPEDIVLQPTFSANTIYESPVKVNDPEVFDRIVGLLRESQSGDYKKNTPFIKQVTEYNDKLLTRIDQLNNRIDDIRDELDKERKVNYQLNMLIVKYQKLMISSGIEFPLEL